MTDPIKIISKKEYLKKNKEPVQEEVWDNISDLWVEFKKKPFFTVEDFLKKASSDFANSEDSKIAKEIKVIDLGCGSGRNMIASPDISYYGVDFSGKQVECAKKIASEKKINAKFFKGSAAKLDSNIFKNEMFDYGLFIATLHCIEGEKERKNALKEFYRVLKVGAEGLISVWNSEDSRFNGLLGDIYMSWKKDGKEHYRYYYLYSKDEFLDLLSSVGFKIIEINTKLEHNDRFFKKNFIVRVKKVK
jgi:ubiquinone/menaquinone biosynthesis C-methylase UbiE